MWSILIRMSGVIDVSIMVIMMSSELKIGVMSVGLNTLVNVKVIKLWKTRGKRDDNRNRCGWSFEELPAGDN